MKNWINVTDINKIDLKLWVFFYCFTLILSCKNKTEESAAEIKSDYSPIDSESGSSNKDKDKDKDKNKEEKETKKVPTLYRKKITQYKENEKIVKNIVFDLITLKFFLKISESIDKEKFLKKSEEFARKKLEEFEKNESKEDYKKELKKETEKKYDENVEVINSVIEKLNEAIKDLEKEIDIIQLSTRKIAISKADAKKQINKYLRITENIIPKRTQKNEIRRIKNKQDSFIVVKAKYKNLPYEIRISNVELLEDLFKVKKGISRIMPTLKSNTIIIKNPYKAIIKTVEDEETGINLSIDVMTKIELSAKFKPENIFYENDILVSSDRITIKYYFTEKPDLISKNNVIIDENSKTVSVTFSIFK